MAQTQQGKRTLSRSEVELWRAWQRATDAVTGGVGRALASASGLSEADYGVLCSLTELGRGQLRQQALADAMGWQKSRLSHHLSRMQSRALVRREASKANGVLVLITAAGKRALSTARPHYARAVQERLIARVPRADRARLLALLLRLSTD